MYFELWKSRGRNVRRKLLRDSLIVLSLVFVVIAILGVWQYRNLRNNLLEETTYHALNEAVDKYDQLIHEQEKVIDFLNLYLTDSTFTNKQIESLLESTLRTNKKIHSISVLRPEGNILFSKSDAEYISTGRISKEFVSDERKKMFHDQDSGWSGAHFSQNTNDAVVSLSKYDKDVKTVKIIMELKLVDLFNYLNDISVSENSEIILFRLNERTIFLPNYFEVDKNESVENQVFHDYNESESKTVVAAFDQMLKIGDEVTFPHVFSSEKQLHWMRAKMMSQNQNSLYVGVIMPESDFLGVIQKEIGFFVLFLISALLFAALLLFSVISKYGNQIKDLPQIHLDKKRAEKDIHDLIEKGESKHLEFKSTVRYHIKAKRNDKAIEFAWLKGIAGFLNSEGGIMLLGVTDNGEIHGLNLDGFENDDKCMLHVKNVVSTALGVSSLRFIKIHIELVKGKQIVIIETEPAFKPFYIKQNNEDLFYVRSGPSSSKLSVSETVDYVKNNF